MGLDTRDELIDEHGDLQGDFLEIPLSKDPSQMVQIGSELDKVIKG